MIGRLRRRAEAAVREQLGEDVVLEDASASFLGLESAGSWQWRGNGYLAASAEAIVFALWLPHRLVVVPRARVTEVGEASSHLGKSYGRPLLHVRFAADSGRSDSAAWRVRDLDRWRSALD